MDRERMAVFADRFDRFAEVECGASPLYQKLARGIALDSDLLALAAHTQPGQPAPNLFLASVHALLLSGLTHPLAAAYPSLNSVEPAPEDPFPQFRAFCLEHADAIRALLQTRRVQTNEVARSALLLPAFQRVAAAVPDQPFFLIEVGCSAGLLLHWDHYQYDFGTGTIYGASHSALRLSCALRGVKTPPLTDSLPVVVGRVGIDILSGDALDLLPIAVEGAPPGTALCVFHCHTLNQFSAQDRQRFYDVLSSLSVDREIHHLSIESKGGDPQLERALFAGGRRVAHELLAHCHGHGEWIEWLV